ncbi:MAG: tRNA pseudouridine(55) synthase TruB [Candidatus Sericytochromatia bacterium]|nr:tRNA pseudouridine(55) synthase TruB [Candidatus Sericytochromatia bacterium]
MPAGLLVLLKPAGMTSFEVVAWARRRLGEKKIGHAGTLDPPAAGVMVLAVGPTTRWLSFLEGTKAYVGEVVFGRSTTTADATGSVTEEQDSCVTRDQIEGVLPRFIGDLMQRPPAVSAVRHEGVRSYSRVRAGEAVVLPERPVRVHDLDVLAFDPGRQAVRLWVRCSAGTYVRSLAVDLGRALGVPAHLSFLVRTAVGPFDLSAAAAMQDDVTLVCRPLEDGMSHWPRLDLDESQARDFMCGRAVDGCALRDIDREAAAWHRERFIGLGAREGDLFRPRRVVPSL